jgi:hypothetical protein
MVTGLDSRWHAILGIKGYRPQYRTDSCNLPEWFHRLADAKGTSDLAPVIRTDGAFLFASC